MRSPLAHQPSCDGLIHGCASANPATDAIVDAGECCPSTEAAARNLCAAVGSAATRARITADSSRGAGRPPSSLLQSGNTDLIEQRSAVEGVSFRVGSQSSRPEVRQRSQP